MKRVLLPLIILAVAICIGALVLWNPPTTERRDRPSGPRIVVEVETIKPRRYQVNVASYGTVAPRTQSMLTAQVGGQILDVAVNFRDGGFFNAGDALITIDPRDYEADVKIADATLMDALQRLSEEGARFEQAQVDWRRLGNDGTPTDLVLRKPQKLAAEARVLSARSALQKAELDLERTRVRAPFAGRVLRKSVDLGQVVANNAQLAQVYATDYVEIRLPLRNSDLGYVALPEADSDVAPNVMITSELGRTQTWQGRIVRTEGAIDAIARQLHVVAQIDEPFSGDRPLKIGEYVTAVIDGTAIPNAIVIPNLSIYQGAYVFVVEDGLLVRREIDIAWQNETEALIRDGLNARDQLVTTALGQVTSGIPVRVAGSSGVAGKAGLGNKTPDGRGGVRPSQQPGEAAR